MQAPRAFFGRLHELPVVVLKGCVRYVTARALRSFVDDLLNERNDAIVLDLRELEAIDSTGMGLLARLGRSTLQHGRRSVIVCDAPDVTTCLRSAAFDRLFLMLREWPFPEEPEVAEVPVHAHGKELRADGLGRVMLEAHRELASLSEANREEFGAVVSALEAQFDGNGSREAGAEGRFRSKN
ncbi:MAG: STAS domain-containing protein [Polyangiaceae bacterium]|nr:STAS domain-containing protein [Polyangiaceae bacterium]